MGSQCQSHRPRCVQVSAAASVVSQALGELLQHVRQYTARGEPIGRYDQATDTIMNVTENIFSSMGDAGERSPEEKRRLCPSEIRVRIYFITLLLLHKCTRVKCERLVPQHTHSSTNTI